MLLFTSEQLTTVFGFRRAEDAVESENWFKHIHQPKEDSRGNSPLTLSAPRPPAGKPRYNERKGAGDLVFDVRESFVFILSQSELIALQKRHKMQNRVNRSCLAHNATASSQAVT